MLFLTVWAMGGRAVKKVHVTARDLREKARLLHFRKPGFRYFSFMITVTAAHYKQWPLSCSGIVAIFRYQIDRV